MDAYKDFGVTRFKGTLNNGINVSLFHRSGAPVTTYAILKSGARHDPESMPGLAHFLEHMIVNGSKEFPTKDLLAEHIESVGGGFQAKTGQDPMWVITEVSDKSDYSRAVDIYRAMLCEPLMDRKVFENEKKVVIKEIQRNNSNPHSVLGKTIRQLFFLDTPFQHDVVGYEESISGLDYDTALVEYRKLFDKSRISFIVAGDISIEEVVDQLNSLTFLSGNDFPEDVNDFEITNKERILAKFFDAPQTYIYLGVKAPDALSDDSYLLMLLGAILAGGRNSRLMKRLRYNKGLVYSVNANRTGGLFFGSWGIGADTTGDKTQELVNEIIEELKDIQKNGIKESELEFVKNRRLKSLKRSMQTSDSWADAHALGEVFVAGAYDLNTFIKFIQGATVDDIRRIIDTYLAPEKWKLAFVGKNKQEEIKISW